MRSSSGGWVESRPVSKGTLVAAGVAGGREQQPQQAAWSVGAGVAAGRTGGGERREGQRVSQGRVLCVGAVGGC
jgi:hypothetical protein